MRTLDEIVSSARDGEKPSVDELRYAVCAMDALLTFDRMAFMRLAEAEQKGQKPFLTRSAVWQWEEHFRRVKLAFGKSPKDWLGTNNDPDNAEVQERRRAAIQIVEAAARAADNGTPTASPSAPTTR